jgi:hypothetical protein
VTSEHSRDRSESPAMAGSEVPEALLHYYQFIVTQSEYKQRRLHLLSKREHVLTFAFYITSAAAVITSIAAVFLLAHKNEYAAVIPFAVGCLAALATSFKQLQLQTYRRTKDIVRDIRTDELIRGATAALLHSKDSGADRGAVQRLIGALMALGADEVASDQAALPEERTETRHRTVDSWDPISTFLNTG